MEEYAVRKVVESFFNMRMIVSENPEEISFDLGTAMPNIPY